jgi:hypothetical protein
MNYIDANEMVFNNDKENGIHSGGFSVNSIMMKGGMTPIRTLNTETTQKGGMNNVSDIFNDLVVPNWALSYHNMYGGMYEGMYGEMNEGMYGEMNEGMYGGMNKKKLSEDKKHDNDDDDIINDDIHDRLLDLVKDYDKNGKERKKGGSRKTKLSNSKKTSTKRNKK